MEVFSFLGRGFSSNTYLCREKPLGACILIDPGTDQAGVLSFLADSVPEKIVLTHGHFDHITASVPLREATGAPVFVHPEDAPLLEDPEKNASATVVRRPVSFLPDGCLREGDTVSFGACTLKVLHTPGHSPGGICLYGEGCLFCGDTLFRDGVGRTDLFGGSAEALKRSLARLMELPPQTRVFPGHGEAFLLGSRFTQNRFC